MALRIVIILAALWALANLLVISALVASWLANNDAAQMLAEGGNE